ncbi:hypothetical protein BACI348_50411 [Bacillus altitudinis]|uniref:Uncharacterized protein n=1 Tax=Bacillus altitudinis TaxID=293387 RepID=A0A653WA20_BACAB|nr:hypothetical protein BACI348_50411 [Bacillus altitudinis]
MNPGDVRILHVVHIDPIGGCNDGRKDSDQAGFCDAVYDRKRYVFKSARR